MANVFEIDEAALLAVAGSARRIAVAVQAALQPEGLNLLQANGPGAAQSVQHFHIHVLPRSIGDDLPLNWPDQPGDMGAISALAGPNSRATLTRRRGAGRRARRLLVVGATPESRPDSSPDVAAARLRGNSPAHGYPGLSSFGPDYLGSVQKRGYFVEAKARGFREAQFYMGVNEHRGSPRDAGIGEIDPETRIFRRGQGGRVSRSAVYMPVNEHRRSPRNAGLGEIDRFWTDTIYSRN